MQANQQAGTLTMHGTVTIHFIDGTTQCFEFEAPEFDPITSASKMEKFLVREQLQIHLADRVLVIPMQSIKCMEFTPVPHLPPHLSEFVIRDARPASASQAMKWYDLEPPSERDRSIRIHDDAIIHQRPIASIKK